jgi:hypothetical protein
MSRIVPHEHIRIADVDIAKDQDGRFCLNDLHKAAGDERRHGPSIWLENQQAKELAQELSDTGIPVSVVRGGPAQGTYVSKELVYAYAMWISAKFHLQVIRTFDAAVTGQLAAPASSKRASQPKSPVLAAAGMAPSLMRALRSFGIDKNAAAIGANQIINAETGINLLQLAGHTHLPTPSQEICYTPTELGSRFCQSARSFNRRLADAGLQVNVSGHWVPTDRGRAHAVVLDTGKAHSSGTPIQQVKWLDSVLDEVAL